MLYGLINRFFFYKERYCLVFFWFFFYGLGLLMGYDYFFYYVNIIKGSYKKFVCWIFGKLLFVCMIFVDWYDRGIVWDFFFFFELGMDLELFLWFLFF